MDASGTPRSEGGPLSELRARFPYIEAQAVVLAAIALQLSLPAKLTLGPFWVLPAFEGLLLIVLVLTGPMHSARSSLRRKLAVSLIGLVSAANAVSLALLVHYLVRGGKESGRSLIIAGSVLWLTNVLLFGLWYWEMDRGGPAERAAETGANPDFLFPQMSTPELHQPDWRPSLIDYLYVSFTNATAFSPTDTMPLTPSAKVLMAGQSLVSLVTVGLVVARAVNILT